MSELAFEEEIMELIIESGQGRSTAYEALASAKKGDYPSSEELLEESTKHFNKAHSVQTRLIATDEGAGEIPINLIMVHAQDHLMTGLLAKEMVIELIDMHKKINTITQ